MRQELRTRHASHPMRTISGTLLKRRGLLSSCAVLIGLLCVAATPTNGGSWQAARPMPRQAGGLAAATDNGYLFITGGYNGSYQWAGYSTRIVLTNGDLNTWQHITSLPTPLYGHAMDAAFGSLYVLGGTTNGKDSGAQNAVLRTRLLPGGTTGNWKQAGTLPARLYGEGSVVNNGYLYVAGGYSPDQGYSSAVYEVKLGAYGLVGTWHKLTNLPGPRFGLALTTGHGYLFAVGGMSQGQVANTVYTALIQKDGTIGPWTTTQTLSTPLAHAGATVLGDWLIVAGGTTALNLTTPVATAEAAAIAPGGKLGPWRPLANLGSPAAGPAVITQGNYLYVLGGFNGKVYNSAIYRTCPVVVPACTAKTP